MQEIKLVMRQIGVPNGVPAEEGGVVSSQDVEAHLEYNYLSNGYKVQASHYLGAAENGMGYKVLFVLVKESPDVPSVVPERIKK